MSPMQDTKTRVFGLERTEQALRLLALDKTASHCHVRHYDRHLLSPSHGHTAARGHLANYLQEIRRSISAPRCLLQVGLYDQDLIMHHVYLPDAGADLTAQCAALFAQALPQRLWHYSWDMRVLASQRPGCDILCVAYPLQKIIDLQKFYAQCGMVLHVLEPSICALARSGFLLLNKNVGVFLYYDKQLFTLFLSVNGEVFALRAFQQAADLPHYFLELKDNPLSAPYMQDVDTIFLSHVLDYLSLPLAAFEKQLGVSLQTLDILPYVQAEQQYRLQTDGTSLLTCAGLALQSSDESH